MKGNFQNNYRSGWNDMPFDDFSWRQFNYDYQFPRDRGHHYADNMYLPHQMPTHYADDMYLPHQMPSHYADDMYLPRQMPAHYDDMRFLPHQIPEHYDDMRFLPHQIPDHYDDMRFLPHQTPAYHADNRHVTHQRQKQYADKRPLPNQTPEYFADKRNLPRQRPEYYADKRHLPHAFPEHDAEKSPVPHQTPEDFADKRILPHQKPEDYADKMQSPQQKPEHCADKRNMPHQMPEGFADKRILPHQKPEDFAEKRDLPHQKPKDYTDNKCLPHQPPEHFADKRHSPHQTLEPTIPAVPPVKCPKRTTVHCELCDVRILWKTLEHHNNGKKHRRRLSKLCEQSTERKASKEYHGIQKCALKRNDQSNSISMDTCSGSDAIAIAPPQGSMTSQIDSQTKVEEGKEHHEVQSCGVENCADKEGLPHQKQKSTIRAVRKVERVHCEVCDVMFPLKTLEEHNDGKRHRRILSKLCKQSTKDGSPVENMSHEAPRFRYKEVPAEGSKRKVKDINDAKDHGFKRGVGESTGGKYMKMNYGIRRSVKSSKPEINTLSNSVESLVQIPELTSPSGHVASPKMAPIPAEGSSFEPQSQHVSTSLSQESKGNEHHEFQNTTVEKNDQRQSTLAELNASAGSTPVAAVESTFEPKSQEVIQKEISKGKVHNEIQNHTVDSNDQQRSISMDFHGPAGSMTNTQTEAVNSDSAAIEIVTEPLASAQPDASVSEAVNEHGLHTEIEPQVSEAILYNEGQRPIEETDIELLPSEPMEIDSASEVSTETETADGSSQVEEDIDVLTDELETIQLPQVSVCLKCGDEGFEETLVYCNKCEDYALHRYCLDGPVIFTDEVIWFCEDCKEVVDTDYSDSEIAASEKGEVDSSEDCMNVIDPQPIADPIWRGSLQVFHKNNDKITRLMGHLSSLACPKVLEETRHLPNVIYADLLQRSAVWPESFKKFGTNNLSIGLYFFPQNERVERHFDQLVDEMISNDLAIRARIEKAELLIFPSTMLPRQYKRFQSKYYLWGIFKRKKAISTIKDA